MQYTYFFNLTSPFSNFHPSKFTYKNVQFISNEQFMMYCKAKKFKDEVTALKILKINEMDLPARFIKNEVSREEIVQNQVLCDTWKRLMMDIKKLGREVSGYDDAIWNEKRYNIVKYGAKEKFVQNEDLGDILLNTGKTRMCEAAGHDKIWGCGLTEYNAKKTAPENWPGLNLLGHALDEVKNYLFENKSQQKTEDKMIANVEVHNFYTLGKKIPDDGTYIGRYNKQYGLNKSIFANPYKVETPEERGSTIEKYRDWLWNEIAKNQITKNDLISLNNRKLVCYCAPILSLDDKYKDLLSITLNEDEWNEVLKGLEDKPQENQVMDIDVWDYIRVVNVRGDPEYMATPDEKVILAHRGNPILGNKYPMKNKSMFERDRVIAEHKKDLEKDLSQKGPIYNELKLIAKDIVENEQKIALSCFCAPCNCHAHSYLPVIVNLAEDLLLEKKSVKKLKF